MPQIYGPRGFASSFFARPEAMAMAAPIPLRSDAPMSTTTVPVNPRASPRQAKSLTSPKRQDFLFKRCAAQYAHHEHDSAADERSQKRLHQPALVRDEAKRRDSQHDDELIRYDHIFQICKPDDQQSPACKSPAAANCTSKNDSRIKRQLNPAA